MGQSLVDYPVLYHRRKILWNTGLRLNSKASLRIQLNPIFLVADLALIDISDEGGMV
jgi:hypothetical protein